MKAEFTASYEKMEQMPTTGLPEFAFIGRSNVGKSSLINMITGQKSLALTSSTPGKTRLINVFNVDNNFNIVDLPGYGYARLGKKEIARMEKMVRYYLLHRESLFLVYLLLDLRLAPQKSDLEMLKWLGENQIPVSLIFTKADKLKPQEIKDNLERYSQDILKDWEVLPSYFITSAVTRQGKEALIEFIQTTLKEYAN